VSITPRKRQQAIAAYRKVLRLVGSDVSSKELEGTPSRYVDGLIESLRGLHEDVRESFNFTTFENRGDQLIIWRNIKFASTCSHHILPFYGKVWIGILPHKKLPGYSKAVRLTRWCAARPQTQEDFVNLVADQLCEHLSPQFVMVVAVGEHTCAKVRGVCEHDTDFVTSAVRGEKKFSGLRDEFLRLACIPGVK